MARKGPGGPLGGPLEDWLRDYANKPGGTYSGGDPFKAGADSQNTHDFAGGVADVVGGISDVFFPGPPQVADPYKINESSYGMPNAAANQAMLAQRAGAADNRQTLNMSDAQSSRDIQGGLIQQLQGQAAGTGPSIAQQQLQKATDQNIANTQAAAASGRGPSAGGAQYNAQNRMAQAQQQGAGDSAMLRLQEQMQAQNMLGNVAGQQRGQDLSSQQLGLQQRAQNDDLVKFYVQSGLSLEQAQAQAKQALEEMKVKQQIEFEKIKHENTGGGSGGLGGIMSMFGMG